MRFRIRTLFQTSSSIISLLAIYSLENLPLPGSVISHQSSTTIKDDIFDCTCTCTCSNNRNRNRNKNKVVRWIWRSLPSIYHLSTSVIISQRWLLLEEDKRATESTANFFASSPALSLSLNLPYLRSILNPLKHPLVSSINPLQLPTINMHLWSCALHIQRSGSWSWMLIVGSDQRSGDDIFDRYQADLWSITDQGTRVMIEQPYLWSLPSHSSPPSKMSSTSLMVEM